MKTLLLPFFILIFSVLADAQTQMTHFVVGPKTVNVTTPFPNPSLLSTVNTIAPAVATYCPNGWYDNAGHLIFYVCDQQVFDYNNTLLGNIPNGGSEVCIVPFGNNGGQCNFKFNLFSTASTNSHITLYKTVLDMSLFYLQTPQAIDNMTFQNEFGALAVSVEFNSQYRNLYFLAGTGTNLGGQINKIVINHDGSVNTSVPVFPVTPTQTISIANPGMRVFSRELDLSPDGKWLAWASYHSSSVIPRYHLIKLDASGDYDTGAAIPYQEFSIPAINNDWIENGFRGIEFWQDPSFTNTKLFVGAGLDGIYGYSVAMPILNLPNQVSNSYGTISTSYGYSQIELAYNGFMYASSGNSSLNIGAFDPLNSSPTMLSINSFNLPTPPFITDVVGSNAATKLYTLPDQIDGQDYSVFFSPAFTAVPTYYDYTFSGTRQTHHQ